MIVEVRPRTRRTTGWAASEVRRLSVVMPDCRFRDEVDGVEWIVYLSENNGSICGHVGWLGESYRVFKEGATHAEWKEPPGHRVIRTMSSV
jgi:hypothetical protein